MKTCPPEFVDLGLRLADASGAIIRRYFRTAVAVDDKPDRSPVTIADREAEAAMRAMILEVFPGHGVIGEEYDPTNPDAEFVWVLDPIDGTKSFITGRPLFGTLIGLVRHGSPILGIIDHPALGERWVGALGRLALFNNRPAKARPCPRLADAALYATSPHMFVGEDFVAFERLRQAVKFPIYGADCYAYGLLASGFADLVVEASMSVHDFVALAAVVTGAGGIITDWQGKPLTLHSDGRIAAAGDIETHRAALGVLAGHNRRG